jgi:hypothetical protein
VRNKLLITVLMFILIVSISCSEQGKTNYPENETKNETKTEDKIDNEASAAWDLNFAAPKIDIPYQVPEFTPSAGRYEVNEDLSDLFNAGQYEGFTKEQKNAIYEDGFVIMEPSYSVLKMHQIYEWPVYKESPVFITSDSALHLYHIYYDKSLSYVESAVLYDRLDSLSQKLFLESIKNYGNMDYSGLSEELKFVSAYFLTACRILGSNIESIDVPEEISSIADKEVKLIEESSDFAKSPLLRTDLDYSQFTVRGHYTGSEKLEKYFKAMMWYGLCGFPVFDETKPEPELNIDSLTKGMIITCMVLRDEDNFKSHENIYSITSMYTGLSDDLGILEIRELITSVYGKNPDFNTFKDSSYYPELLKEALKLPEPKIKPKTTEVNLPSGRQFRFMGQRFSYDAEIMQNLMEPYLRPIPSGLDVIAAFGSARAEELLDTYYKPKEEWDGYEKMLNKQREENKSISDDEWKADLYKGWLWSIKSSSNSFEDVEGMPEFMRNKKWTDKSIHTALGSYAELKHDSILYVKQPVAEMGGGPDFSIPLNYVEPTVEVYAKLKWLAQNTKAQLKERNLLDEGNAQILDSIIDMQDTLMNISVKELTNQNITEEENIKLYHYGGRIDSIIQNLNRSLKEEGIGTEFDVTSALIADVATVAPNANFPKGTYLEVGNGLPLEIYAVCETNGKTYLAKGALFNYYEFMSDKRLTDGEWQEMMGIRKVKWFFDSEKNQYIKDENGTMNNGTNDDYFEEVELSRPLTGTVSKPLWTDSFITAGENHVISVEDMGLEWWQ